MATRAKPLAAASSGARRLPERIVAAVHQAIDLGDMHSASLLLAVAEQFVARRVSMDALSLRKMQEAVVAAHQRLWEVRSLQLPGDRLGLVPDFVVSPGLWNDSEPAFPGEDKWSTSLETVFQ